MTCDGTALCGTITENDITLARNVAGFSVRPTAQVRDLAEREGVDIRLPPDYLRAD